MEIRTYNSQWNRNVLASSERNITFNDYGVFPCFSLISKGYLLITFAFHIPLFDLRIYHNQCFTDFDIKWFAFVFALPSCVSCSTCLSVSARGQILSQATNACSVHSISIYRSKYGKKVELSKRRHHAILIHIIGKSQVITSCMQKAGYGASHESHLSLFFLQVLSCFPET